MKKTRKQKKETERKRVSNQIYQELEEANSFALAQARRAARDAIDDPIPELAWTRGEKGFEDARVSAENAMLRIWAGTAAARAGRESDPWLGVCLYKIGAGLFRDDSPEILRYMQHAQRIGRGEWFIDRVAVELKNAKKQVPGAPQFNEFRAF
jgi:hypothetical protein